MFIFQINLEILVFFVLVLALLKILIKFGREDLFVYLVIPLSLFLIGFSMRLSSNEPIVNLGFFFTEISSIWLYVLFVLALLLGQIKYWKK